MVKKNKKNNVPYYILGGLAIPSGIAFGILAASPSLAFLAPIAGFAVSLGTPLIGALIIASFGVAMFSSAAIIINYTRSKQEAKLADKTKEIEGLNNTISKKDAQLVQQSREIKAKIEHIINSDEYSTWMHEERKAKRAAEDVDVGDMHLDKFFDDALVKPAIETDTQSQETILVNGKAKNKPNGPKRKKNASKQKESGWLSKKQKAVAVIGSVYGLGAVATILPYILNLFNPANNNVHLTSNSTGVGNARGGYAPSLLPILPDSPKDVVQSELDIALNMFNAFHEKEKVGFGIANPSEEFGSTSISLSMKDRFFNLFPWKSTTAHYVNGIAYEAASKAVNGTIEAVVDEDAVESIRVLFNETLATQTSDTVAEDIAVSVDKAEKESTPTSVSQNDPTHGCTVFNVRKYDNQTFAPNPCHLSDYRVPLHDLQHVAICCPLIQEEPTPTSVHETPEEIAATSVDKAVKESTTILTNGYGIGTALKSVAVGVVGAIGGAGVVEAVRVLGDLADVVVRAGAYRW
ncbi:hypothetical protein [Wolbachia endosymbiont of Folsomia candida]|uniref:hypothetical protein n=1 Tax=Wolbachia endosymbiont of Folsomia candida TaxID=169402 RepID=UPI000A90DACE|nr:hypothetical protein [Wolbachia endosymbiont of Folsomia candida]APR98712.1 hypothetical protein ASM33_05720 [Wolbachia endosymbiont of Folsomia candida]